MKRIVTLCIAVFIACETYANFEMPRTVYRMDQLEQAKDAASLNKQAISVIVTHEKTSCPLCESASLKAANTLSPETLVVYADCDTEFDLLPPRIQKALQSRKAGHIVPIVIILNAKLNHVIEIVPYTGPNSYDQLLHDAINKLSAPPSKWFELTHWFQH